jgi:hypothetical protein
LLAPGGVAARIPEDPVAVDDECLGRRPEVGVPAASRLKRLREGVGESVRVGLVGLELDECPERRLSEGSRRSAFQ